jgi:hypothetical protein
MIKTIKINKENKKNIPFEHTIETGIIILGKETFLIRLALSTIEVVTENKEILVKDQGSIPHNKNTGKFWTSILTILEKTKDKITIINKGVKTTHKNPNEAVL